LCHLNRKPAHGRFLFYPAQLNPPREPQLLLAETLDRLSEFPRAAIVDIFLRVSWPWQEGQSGLWLAWEKGTIFSNSSPQSLH
jgi:hypothetical protein